SVGVQFTHYGVAQSIPTSLELPCAGQGLVIFSPEPSSSTARPATVTVNYVEEGELGARCRHPCLPSIHLGHGWLAKFRAPRGGARGGRRGRRWPRGRGRAGRPAPRPGRPTARSAPRRS